MSVLIIYIFESVQVEIAECGVLLLPEDHFHIFFKKETVLDPGAGIMVCFAGKVMGSALLVCNVNDDVHIGIVFLPFDRK